MPLKLSGVRLVAEQYSQYIKQMKEVQRANQDAFKTGGMRNWEQSASRVTSSSRKMKAAADDTWRTVQNLRDAFNSTSQSANRFANSGSGISGFLGNMKSGLSGGITGLKNMAGSIGNMIPSMFKWLGLIKLVTDALQFLGQSGDIAQRNETLRVTLDEIGDSAGYSKQQIDFAVDSLKEQGITTSAAQQSLIRMARANISWADASKLAAIAQGSAVAAGMASSDAFDRLVLGIQKQEPELLDELGITLKRSDAYKRFAEELGVSAAKLTDAQKQQALLNDVYRQSESVLGVYEAAMETSGKKQGSLTRHVEEAQASFGKLLLPVKELQIDMKTNLWKGIREVAKGMELWVPIIRAAIDGIMGLKTGGGSLLSTLRSLLGNIIPVIGVFDKLKQAAEHLGIEFSFKAAGKGAQTWGRITVQSAALVGAAFQAAKATITNYAEEIKNIGTGIAEGFGRFAIGDFAGAANAFNEIRTQAKGLGAAFSEEFGPRAGKALADVEAKFPDLFRDFDEIGVIAETSLDRVEESVDAANAALDEQKSLLEQQIPILKELAKIQTDYEKSVEKINQTFSKRQDDLNKKAADDEEKIRAKTLKQQEELTKDSSKQRQKLIDDFNKQQIKSAQQRNKELAREQERFRLSQMQAERRFQVTDRRLRAEGDVIGLMQAREDFALQQQEAKENNELKNKNQEDAASDQRELQKQDLKDRLREFDANVEERKRAIEDAQAEELSSLQESIAKRREELEADRIEQLELAKQNRVKQLQELGKSLQDQENITEEGMQAIFAKMEEFYGPGAEVDALITGYTERMTEGFAGMVEDIQAELSALNQSVANTVTNLATLSPGASAGLTTPNSITGSPLRPRAQGMRQGGVGVVSGPATFAVEPGQREAVMFAPLPTVPSSNVNVNMSGGFNISGAESAGRASTEAALDRMVDEFTIAVNRMSRRGN